MSIENVSDVICRALIEEGTEVVFGHPGGAILPLYDALYRAGAPRHVLVRHEQAGAHAADGYARAAGRPGVCFATSGPGATNLITGLATAMMDSVPMVAVTGQVPKAVQGTEAFQETDVLGLTFPVTKHGFVVDEPADAVHTMREAFRVARSGRPGPVVVDIPKDVQTAAVRGYPDRGPVPGCGGVGGLDAAIEEIVRLVGNAERPVVIAGRGVVLSQTSEALRRFAERADLPVVTTLLGLDAFPSSHPLSIGMPGMHGSERANRAIHDADLVIGLGLRFDDRVTGPAATFAPRATIVHVDIDPCAMRRTVRTDLHLVCDLALVLPELARRAVEARRGVRWSALAKWDRWCRGAGCEPLASAPVSGREAARALARQAVRDGAVVTTDVGQHQMWVAQELRDAAPGSHLTSGGLGTMGYALPAALGAALATGGRPVWAIAGDGGFQMTLQELATLVQEEVPVRIAVVNNGFLGMVRQWQARFFDRRYSASELGGPDFVRLAEAYGIPARAVEAAGELADALDWASAAPGPVLLELRVVREQDVYPMVPPGAPLNEMLLEPEFGR